MSILFTQLQLLKHLASFLFDFLLNVLNVLNDRVRNIIFFAYISLRLEYAAVDHL